jgi:hypothetical protein
LALLDFFSWRLDGSSVLVVCRVRLQLKYRAIRAAIDLIGGVSIMSSKYSLTRAASFIAGLLATGFATAAPVLWVSDVNGNLGTVDVATDKVKVIGNMGHVMTDIAFDPMGHLYGIGYSALYSVNPSTGASTLIGNMGGTFNSLVFDASGKLYAAGTSLYSIDVTTGQASLIGKGGYSYASSGDLAFVGGKLYLSSSGTKDSLVQLNTANGFATRIGGIGYASVYGLASDNNIDLYGMAGTRVLEIDVATGAGETLLNYQGHGLGAAYGSAFLTEASAPVPEPATYAMMLSGLGLLALAAKRRAPRKAYDA